MQITPLEAMSVGIPIIISNVGIASEIRTYCEDFILIDWSVKSINKRIKKIKKNYCFYSTKSLEISKKFSIAKFESEYVKLFEKI